jgi:gas vesicle protein
MVDNATLQAIIGHLNELKMGQEEFKSDMKSDISALKTNINDVKTGGKYDIRAVAIGQVDLKTELKNDISDVKDEINTGQEELRQEIKAFQERIRNIEDGQAAFEERVTRTVNTRLEDVSSMVERQTRNLREDLSRNIEVTR